MVLLFTNLFFITIKSNKNMKINKYIMFALAVGMLTACDPNKEEGDFDVTNITSEQLLEGATFAQYSGVTNDDGTITYTPSETGNYIEFNIPSVSSVDVYALKKDGSELSLSTGKSGGIINYVPTRGSDPEQTIYFRFINQDGEEIVASKVFTLSVAQELSEEMKLICSNSGSKSWTWSSTRDDGAVWGNAGNSGGAWDGSSVWWGCTPVGETADDSKDFSGQMNHSGTGNVEETEEGAYMVFNEDGTVVKYSKDGAEISSGTFAIQNWTGGEQTNWVAGTLHIDGDGILFPFMINSGGKQVSDFNISILTADQLVLTYYENEAGGWGEATWWSFGSKSDYEGMLNSNSAKSWTWSSTRADGAVWGNAGNAGGTWDGSSVWWGCCPVGADDTNDFSTQMNHSGTGNVEETELGAYMTFDTDGILTKYSKDGTVIGSGKYEVQNFTTTQTNWNQGTLHVDGDGILFPFMINSGGKQVTDFNISGLTSNSLILTYYENEAGGWGEATWWSFGPKSE